MNPQGQGATDSCPRGGKDKSVVHRVVHDACVKLGGEHALARHLGIDLSILHSWLQGYAVPNDTAFVKCLDLLGID